MTMSEPLRPSAGQVIALFYLFFVASRYAGRGWFAATRPAIAPPRRYAANQSLTIVSGSAAKRSLVHE